jgi:hypothetical protein
MRIESIVILFLLLAGSPASAGGVYQEPEQFIEEAFGGAKPEPQVIWLTGERKAHVRAILDHDYASMRVHYWRKDGRSVWILEEIGKDQPITAGFIVDAGRLESVKVLVFRESRGWEIRHPFFTDQFKDAGLDDAGALNKTIDGISGATLSVRAMKKLAALALYLDGQADAEHVQSAP